MTSYLINSRLVEDILTRNNHLNSPKFEKHKRENYDQLKLKAIEEEAKQHSIKIERDLEKKSQTSDYIIKPNFEQFIKQITKAQEWAYNNTDASLTMLIKGVAGIINGEEQPLDYRIIGVRPSGAKVTPPYPAKISLEMERFIDNYDFLEKAYEKGDVSAMDLAFYTHFQIARIHPFEDGNGRTSRTIQNLLLEKDNLPPAVIFRGERETYRKLLENAILGYQDRDAYKKTITSPISKEESQFYNFLATKTNIAIDLVLEGSFNKLSN
ncbi:MAG: Fic family protein [Nanoarchaeota archaeon]|nr:Fic family protein [Nanoarchaeota archaeon]